MELPVIDAGNTAPGPDEWVIDEAERKRSKAALSAFIATLMLGLDDISISELSALAVEGMRWGGKVDRTKAAQIASRVNAAQRVYRQGFQQALEQRIEEILAARWTSRESFLDGVTEFYEYAINRAESYALGGGQPAWRDGIYEAATDIGMTGGIWLCTFADGSCDDCLALHGKWMTFEEMRATWGTTQCDGHCLCGFLPTEQRT